MKKIIVSVYLIIPLVMSTEYVLENCQLHSKNHKLIIDLSQIQNNDWTKVENSNASYYFSMCPGKTAKCPNEGYFCLRDNGTYFDLGSTYLETTADGDMLNVAMKGTNGSGILSLRCDGSEADPIIIDIDTSQKENARPFYKYSMLWASSAVCPLKHHSAENTCILYIDPQKSYDIRPLWSAREVTAGNKTYVINFCEVDHRTLCPSLVCLMENGIPVPVSDKFQLSYLERKGLSINYKTKSGTRIIVALACSHKEENELKFLSKDNDDLIFSIETPFVCEFPKMNCLLHLKENIVYDLSPLNKMTENYMIHLTNGKTIIMNFCGPLNYKRHIDCADGTRNFGCLVGKDYHTEAIATSASNVSILKPGRVSVTYQGNGVKSLFLNISLICDQHVSIYPQVHHNSSDYRYDIIWKTYAACPLKYASGKNCEVTNLYTKNSTNFSHLYNDSDYYIRNAKESFRMNICGKLNRSCAKDPSASVCYINSEGKEMSIGEIGASEPLFIDGQFVFQLIGEPCNKNVTKSKVHIVLACDYSKKSRLNVPPELFPNNKEDECQFYFYWKTPFACEPPLSSKCIYSKDDITYDLSPLKNFRENYVVNYKESRIELNVCHSLIPGHRNECHKFAGACITNTSIQSIILAAHNGTKSSDNLGFVSKEDEFEVIDNKLRMHYNGGICTTGNHGTYSTTIDFICDKTAVHTEPLLVSDQNCIYNFTWTTSVACPTYKKKNCSTVDPVSGKRFDLSSLMGKDVPVNGSSIIIGVCHHVGVNGCPKNSGACVLRNSSYESVGDYNSLLHYANGTLKLVYKARKCNSVIMFSCSDEEESNPFLVKENGCSNIISWPTMLACVGDEEMLNCCQGIEDLCERFFQTYEVSVNQTETVFINLCKPLLPKRGLLCPPNSISCVANNQSADYFTSEKSLGSISRPPIINDSAVVLEYVSGSMCRSGVNYSTLITFVCDKNAADGHPELINIKNYCTYEFKWVTSVICHEKCPLSAENKNMKVLGHYKDWDRRIVSKTGKSTPYVFNPCRFSEKCGSNICKMMGDMKWQRFATMNSTDRNSANITDKKTEIFYSYLMNKPEKARCGAKVDLICDVYDSGPGRPLLKEETDCFIHVEWKSNLACLNEKPSSSSNLAVWIVFSVSILLLVGIVFTVIRLNSQINLRSFVSRTFQYRRDLDTTELQM